jgi:hypothetical protein
MYIAMFWITPSFLALNKEQSSLEKAYHLELTDLQLIDALQKDSEEFLARLGPFKGFYLHRKAYGCKSSPDIEKEPVGCIWYKL